MKSIIIYTTKHGSVEKASKYLSSRLDGEVLMVNLMKEEVPAFDGIDNVILAGSIYVGKIQKEMTDYVSKNLPELLKKQVGLFICAGSPQIEARYKELESSFPTELYNHAVSKDVFGYEILYEKLGFFERLIMKAVKGDKNSVSEFYEDRINAFAKAIVL